MKSELTEKSVFKREIKTEFVQGKDGLISGMFSKAKVLVVWCCRHRDVGNIMMLATYSWWQHFDFDDIFCMLVRSYKKILDVDDQNDKNNFVSNIRRQHWDNLMIQSLENPAKQINLDGSKLKIIKSMELSVKHPSLRNLLFKHVKYKGNFEIDC